MLKSRVFYVVVLLAVVLGSVAWYWGKKEAVMPVSDTPLPSPPSSSREADRIVDDAVANAIQKDVEADRDVEASHVKPIESLLLSSSGLTTDAEKALADEKRFDSALQAIHDQYYGDPEAIDQTKAYETQLLASFDRADSGVSLRKLACGLSVCGALLDGKSMPRDIFVGKFMGSTRQDGLNISSSNIRIVPPQPEKQETQYRVFFTTDPSSNIIRGGVR